MSYAEFVAKQQSTAKTASGKKAEEQQKSASGAVEMKYSEYKNKYAHCKTVPDSYDKKNKTIMVIINQNNGLCPHCESYCYGDCQA